MTVTNTLATKKALTTSGLTEAQAETMANLDEQHATDAAEHISRVFEAVFVRFESKIDITAERIRSDFHATVRNQTWAIIAFGFALAGAAVTVATLLRK